MLATSGRSIQEPAMLYNKESFIQNQNKFKPCMQCSSFEQRKWEDLGFRCELVDNNSDYRGTQTFTLQNNSSKSTKEKEHTISATSLAQMHPICHQQNEGLYKMFTSDSGLQPLHTIPNPKFTFADRMVQHTQFRLTTHKCKRR